MTKPKVYLEDASNRTQGRPLVGWIIAAASVVAVVGSIAWKCVAYGDRWDVPKLGGVPVIFEGSPDMEDQEINNLAVALQEIRLMTVEAFPGQPELADFRVIVRPARSLGKIGEKEIGGTMDVDRMLPWTEKHYVAIVQDIDSAYFVAHEVTRHIIPFRAYGDFDADHGRDDTAKLESEFKQAIAKELTFPQH